MYMSNTFYGKKKEHIIHEKEIKNKKNIILGGKSFNVSQWSLMGSCIRILLFFLIIFLNLISESDNVLLQR